MSKRVIENEEFVYLDECDLLEKLSARDVGSGDFQGNTSKQNGTNQDLV